MNESCLYTQGPSERLSMNITTTHKITTSQKTKNLQTLRKQLMFSPHPTGFLLKYDHLLMTRSSLEISPTKDSQQGAK